MAKNENQLTVAYDAGEDRLREYLDKKGHSHEYYKWYTKLSVIERSLSNGILLLSSGADWNDPEDACKFNNSTECIRFGKCFSFSKSENVAMWFLYSQDEKGEGAMLNITETLMKKLLREICLHYAEIGLFEKEDTGQKVFRGKPLSIKEDWLELTDILYVGNGINNDTLTIKRSNETCDRADKSFFDFGKFQTKDYAWNYENETRLVITIPKAAIPEGMRPTHLLVKMSEDTAKVLSRRVVLSPNYSGTSSYTRSNLKIKWG